MPNEEVVAESTPAPVVEAPVLDTAAVTPETPATQAQETPADAGNNQEVQAVEPVDETGVPWKNRAFEWQRKTQELTERLPNIIQEELQKFKQTSEPVQKKYTVAELEAFAQQSPEYRPWVEEQKAQLLQEKMVATLETRLKANEEQTKAASLRQQSEAQVVRQFPNMFSKDANGNIGWNHNDPMTQRMAAYLQEPELKANPRGLEVAAKLAYADLAMAGVSVKVQTEQKLKTQVKALEKKVMTEGAGRPVVPQVAPMKKSMERLAQTGNLTDAKDAVQEYFKAIGRLSN
jgi:hypothetical protein